jgi:hypothetical protein
MAGVFALGLWRPPSDTERLSVTARSAMCNRSAVFGEHWRALAQARDLSSRDKVQGASELLTTTRGVSSAHERGRDRVGSGTFPNAGPLDGAVL